MTEQFRLEQALGQRAAVERQEQTFGSRRQLVQIARDDLFSRSRLALNEDGAFGGRDLFGQAQDIGEEA